MPKGRFPPRRPVQDPKDLCVGVSGLCAVTAPGSVASCSGRGSIDKSVPLDTLCLLTDDCTAAEQDVCCLYRTAPKHPLLAVLWGACCPPPPDSSTSYCDQLAAEERTCTCAAAWICNFMVHDVISVAGRQRSYVGIRTAVDMLGSACADLHRPSSTLHVCTAAPVAISPNCSP
eukprot:364089-Chlamydomonas_euryale.AAC.13